jgi:hypothetical protein
MSGERRTSGDRRAPTTVSVRRLEGKIEELADQVKQDREATNKNTERLDALHLNGDITALRDMAEFWRKSGPHLRQLVAVAPSLVEAVERDTDMRIFWKVLRRLFNPFKPLGALLWAGFVTLATAIVWNFATSGHTLFHR